MRVSDDSIRSPASTSNDSVTIENGTLFTCYASLHFVDDINSKDPNSECKSSNTIGVAAAPFTLKSRMIFSPVYDRTSIPVSFLRYEKNVGILLSSVSSQSEEKAREVFEQLPKKLREFNGIAPIPECISAKVKIIGCTNLNLK
jgi:hypothetical protein